MCRLTLFTLCYFCFVPVLSCQSVTEQKPKETLPEVTYSFENCSNPKILRLARATQRKIKVINFDQNLFGDGINPQPGTVGEKFDRLSDEFLAKIPDYPGFQNIGFVVNIENSKMTIMAIATNKDLDQLVQKTLKLFEDVFHVKAVLKIADKPAAAKPRANSHRVGFIFT